LKWQKIDAAFAAAYRRAKMPTSSSVMDILCVSEPRQKRSSSTENFFIKKIKPLTLTNNID
jgi:hypothetical protein